ncbi:class I adenylate-forming enzyme family protein [Pantoea sp. App145]|uniref:class I adenylate-forming enzyme family protein n=1 Tax=Pantoea sp. App145 TaxID=3071567 RepID=UPI003A805E07
MILTNLGTLHLTPANAQQAAFITPGEDQQEQQISYAQLDTEANALAKGLLNQGYLPGQRIALLGRNSISFIISLLGILRAGLVAVPVNIKLPDTTLEKILEDSDARLVIGDSDQVKRLDNRFNPLTFSLLPSLYQSGEFTGFIPQPDDLALLLYTSGSTGMPKGVRLTHASHRWVVEIRRAAGELEGERVLIAAPFYHMNALALALLTLNSGVTTVLLPQFEAKAYIRAVARYRCSWLTAVPPMIAMMMQQQDTLAENDLSSVRVVRMGSAPVNEGLNQQIRQLWPHARIINAYGTTEAGPVVFTAHPEGMPAPVHATGYPHPGVELRLRDDAGQLSDRGVLEIRSPALMQGYHQRPELNPITVDGFYHTGDVFERDADGFYTFVGRHDDMFVSGGENIYPSEVEKLLELHPDVQQACVIAIVDNIKGSKPVAWVIPRPGSQPTPLELKSWVLNHGPAYLHPRHIWLTTQFPLAGTNKVDKQALRVLAERSVSAEKREEQV